MGTRHRIVIMNILYYEESHWEFNTGTDLDNFVYAAYITDHKMKKENIMRKETISLETAMQRFSTS